MKIKRINGSHNSTYIIVHWHDEDGDQYTVYEHQLQFATLADAQRWIENKSPAPKLKPKGDGGCRPKM